jgi:hypothetical protein
MNRHDEDRLPPHEPPDDEESVRRLIESAGPRAEVPAEDLAAISAAARLAWRRQLREDVPERADRSLAGEPRSAAGLGRRVDEAPAPRRHERRLGSRRASPAVLVALAAMLLAAAGLGWWWATRPDTASPDSLAVVATVESVKGAVRITAGAEVPHPLAAGVGLLPGAELRSGAGAEAGRASLRLGSDVAVRLDAGTRLRLVSASILVLERGAIYADTGAGAERDGALEVRTPLGVVRDVGTRFTVRVAGPDGPALAGGEPALVVRVRDGAVRTERSGRVYVTPTGEELALHGDGRAERREIASYGPEWEWVLEAGGGFEVEGRTLREFLDWVARETGWRIVVEDAALARSASEIVLHGSLGGLRADEAAFAVLPGAGLEAELRDGTLLVRRQ